MSETVRMTSIEAATITHIAGKIICSVFFVKYNKNNNNEKFNKNNFFINSFIYNKIKIIIGFSNK